MLRLRAARAKRPGWISPPVDVEVDGGEIAAIIGPSGSGKTSILRAVLGLSEYDGSIEVGGAEVRSADKRMLRAMMAYVPEEPDTYIVARRVVDEVAFNLENLGYEPDEVAERALRALEAAHLLEAWNRDVWTLSGGERQRLVMASALSTSPSLILLDNPFSNMDWEMRREISGWVKKLVEEGAAVVYTGYSPIEELPGPDHVVYLGEPPGPRVYRRERAGGRGGEDFLLVENVRFKYGGGPEVLRGVTFTARRGEIVAVLGRNGAGKTTLLKIVSGLLKPASGSVVVGGRRAGPGRCVYVPQNPTYSLIRGTPREELGDAAGADAWRLVEEVGLGHILDKPMHSISLGEKRLVSLLSSIHSQASLIALDEPTVGLDDRLVDAVGELLSKASMRGATILVASHDRAFAEAVSDRVLLLDGGVVRDAAEI